MDCIDLNNLLNEIETQESECIFKNFDSTTALEIGNILISKGQNLGNKITIDISKFNQQLFHFAFDNTSCDNDEWIKRKNNIVKHFYKILLECLKKSTNWNLTK